MLTNSPAPAAKAAEAPAAATREVVRAVADVVSLVEPRLLALWRSTGMTFGQRRVLRQLREGPRPAGSIAASLGIAAPTLTRQLVKLEGRGLVTRDPDPVDRRRVLVGLTAEGRRSLADHSIFKGGPIVAAARDLTAAEQAELVRVLNRFVGSARRHLDGSQPGE